MKSYTLNLLMVDLQTLHNYIWTEISEDNTKKTKLGLY